MKRANRVLSEREKDILELREAKVPYKTIAEKYGVSKEGLRYKVKKYRKETNNNGKESNI